MLIRIRGYAQSSVRSWQMGSSGALEHWHESCGEGRCTQHGYWHGKQEQKQVLRGWGALRQQRPQNPGLSSRPKSHRSASICLARSAAPLSAASLSARSRSSFSAARRSFSDRTLPFTLAFACTLRSLASRSLSAFSSCTHQHQCFEPVVEHCYTAAQQLIRHRQAGIS